MAVGNTFNRRLAGNVLTKATGLGVKDGVVGGNYDYIELGAKEAYRDDDVIILAPENEPIIKQRVMVVVNPRIGKLGPFNFQSICEPGDPVMVAIQSSKEFNADDFGWIFRIYVLR